MELARLHRMSKYTLLDYVLSLGGRVTEVGIDPDVIPFLQHKVAGTLNGGVPKLGGEPVEGAPLSKAHIRPLGQEITQPYVEYRAGASILRSSRGGVGKIIGGGKRGDIKGFSSSSRRRLLYTIGGIIKESELPMFITLTYPNDFALPDVSKRHLSMFIKRIRRQFPKVGLIWKLEPQKRGAPHFHMLAWGCDPVELQIFVPQAWFEIAGGGDELHLMWHRGELRGTRLCVQPVQSWKGVWAYASKYLGKTFEVAGWEDIWTGRYWGVINRKNIPFGELVKHEVRESEAVQVMRYQRRFSGIKKSSRSLTVFCDVNQWVEKLKLK